MIVVLWLAFSFLVAAFGNHKKIGFMGALLISIIFSPLIGLIFVVASKPKPAPVPPTPAHAVKMNYRCKHCGFVSKTDADFCPACDRDDSGLTKEDYKQKLTPP